MFTLRLLGLFQGCPQTDRNVVCHIFATQTPHGGMSDTAIIEDCDICSSTTHINQNHTHLLLLGRQNGITGCKGFQDQIYDLYTGPPDALADVLSRGDSPSNRVDIGL